jgi:hypothetical protein
MTDERLHEIREWLPDKEPGEANPRSAEQCIRELLDYIDELKQAPVCENPGLCADQMKVVEHVRRAKKYSAWADESADSRAWDDADKFLDARHDELKKAMEALNGQEK